MGEATTETNNKIATRRRISILNFPPRTVDRYETERYVYLTFPREMQNAINAADLSACELRTKTSADDQSPRHSRLSAMPLAAIGVRRASGPMSTRRSG